MGLTWFDAAAATLIAMLEERLRFETLLSDLSAKLIHVDAGGLDAALEGALRQMITFLGVDRGNLDEYSEGSPGVRVCWAEPDVETLPSILEAGQFPWTAGTLRRGGVVRFPRTDALRAIVDSLGVDRAALIAFPTRGAAGAAWSLDGAADMSNVPGLVIRLQAGEVVRIARPEELPDGITSMVAVPLRAAGAVLGGLLVATVGAKAAWPDELMEQLHLVGETVANALASAQAEREAGRLRQELAHIGRVSAMGELTASLAHELNQPLTAILNNAEVAQQHLQAAAPNLQELREILDDIVADDKRAAEVIQRLRVLLKKGALEHLPLDINDVVGEVAQLVRNDVVLRNVPMTVDLASGLPVVRGDRVQLQQVILNMVLNGLEAMAEPNGHIRALVIRTGRAGDEAVRVAVEDAGVGIDTDDLERLFQPLYTTKPEGLGMGLAIARTIIEAHGGHLRGSNNAAGGATFQFTLPVAGGRSR